MSNARYTRLAASLPASVPFVGPETTEREMGRPFAARLGANENTFGCSPKALAAIQDASRDLWMYGDPQSYDLRAALAEFHGIGMENIVVGEGIDGLLGYLVRLLIEPGDVVVTSRGAYPTFNYHVTGFGGTLHMVPYRDDHEDIEALMAAAAELRPKLVYLANPDNPMGSWHRGQDIVKALDLLPEGTLLVLDEAYVELAPEGTAAPIDIEDPRVIRMRTFSKAYGLAGARVGYAMGAADLIRSFDKIRNHFGMNRAAQAGALAALQDQEWLVETIDKIAQSRTRIGDIVARVGFRALPSATNFVAIDCGRDEAYAKAILAGLMDKGIFLRMPFAAPQNRCLRLSCGRPEDINQFETALLSMETDLRTL